MSTLTYTDESGAEVRIAYTLHRTDGDARGLVLYVHGLGSSRLGTKNRYLKDGILGLGFDFLVFEFQGHGESSGDFEGLTLSRQLADLGAVLGELAGDHKTVVPIGSSLGGWTTAWYAAKHPGAFTAVILIAPAFRLVGDLKEGIGPDGVAEWKADGAYTFQGEEGPFTFRWDIAADLEAYPIDDLHRGLSGPVLIAHGKKDAVVPYEGSVTLKEKAANANVELFGIPDGDHGLTGHLPELEEQFHAFIEKHA